MDINRDESPPPKRSAGMQSAGVKPDMPSARLPSTLRWAFFVVQDSLTEKRHHRQHDKILRAS